MQLCHIKRDQPENFSFSQCIYHKTQLLIFDNKQMVKNTNYKGITISKNS